MNPVMKEEKETGLKVIGAGWGRTGTASLKRALEMLGYNPTFHMFEIVHNPIKQVPLWSKITRLPFPQSLHDFVNKYSQFVYHVEKETIESKAERRRLLSKAYHGYNATVDFPSSIYFSDLLEMYPDAKVVLSVRGFDGWYDSVMNTIYNFHPLHDGKSLGLKLHNSLFPSGMAMTAIGNFNSVLPISEDKSKVKQAFDAWVDHVKAHVPKDRLLVLQVGKEGWKPMCDFLEIKNCPTEPFPHVNDSGEMGTRIFLAEMAGYASGFLVICFIYFIIKKIISKSNQKHKKIE